MRTGHRRGLSPVIGTVLLLAIVVLLVGVSATLIFGVTDQQSPAPQASLALEPTDVSYQYKLTHTAGEPIDGDQVVVRGIADTGRLSGRELAAGESVRVDPLEETVRVVWFESEPGGASYVLREFAVDSPAPSRAAVTGGFPGGTVFTGTSSGIISIEGDGGRIETIPNTDNVAATGSPGTDVTGDGDRDIPYATSSEAVKVVNSDGDVTQVTDSSAIPGAIETSKTRLAIGSWDGSPTSVFFVNQNHDTLYRATPAGTPQVVATPGNGVQGVVGVGDVDGDADPELVFADGSQQLRYIDGPGGSIENVEGGQTGSNNGVGAGRLADVDGDAADEIVAVDGSNEVVVVEDPSSATDSTTTIATDAVKAPVTVADVDGDGAVEVVYIGTTNRRFKYVDDPLGAATVTYLTDEDGNRVGGSDETGVV